AQSARRRARAPAGTGAIRRGKRRYSAEEPMSARDSLLSTMLVRLYPRDFRDRYGESIAAFHRDRIREAHAQSASAMLAWARIISDAISTALLEHIRAARTPLPVARSPQPSTRHPEPVQSLIQDLRYAIRTL